MANYIKVTDQGVIFAELSASENPGGGWTQVEDGQAGLAGRTYDILTGVLGPEIPPKKTDFELDLEQKLKDYSVWSDILKTSIANSAPDQSISKLTEKVDQIWSDYLIVLQEWSNAE